MKFGVLGISLTAMTLALAATQAQAGKEDDTLNWATDREVSVIDP